MDFWGELFDAYDEAPDAEGVVCKFCGEPFLTWEGSPHGWRLFDTKGHMHACNSPQPPATADEFPLL